MILSEELIRIREIMGVLSEDNETQKLNACKSIFSNQLLDQAKDWWLQTLASPATFSKMIYKKYGIKSIEQIPKAKGDTYLKEIKSTLLNAMNLIKKIKLNYSFESGNHLARVADFEKEVVVINCNNISNKEDALSILVHELQHSIDSLLETEDTWVPQRRFDPNKPLKRVSIEYLEDELDKYIDIFGGKSNNTTYLDDHLFSKDYIRKTSEFVNKTYNCNPTEIASRASEVRRKFKMPISQPITTEFLRRNRVAYDLMRLTLYCWAAREDNLSLEDFLTNVDVLVKKQNKSNINQV